MGKTDFYGKICAKIWREWNRIYTQHSCTDAINRVSAKLVGWALVII
ncbi:hypothetical protein H6G04_00760 [Calothrix membranacea FACHB-236]|nr:hypothetical protein [Calothrix membranacea FACHB-236]